MKITNIKVMSFLRRLIRNFAEKAKSVLVFAGSFLLVQSALANPVLDKVTAGQVTISSSPNTLNVNQASQKAIIDWKSFNINQQESTHFQQPQGGVA
ncbi:MAG: hypothetical protein JO149_05735, partial [Gammaproteobacteria bacterium]|nr:hypothetical protein [Gammaproteobacteria bacterium]